MLSDVFGGVLCSVKIYSTLWHRKLLGETSKGFFIQTGPPVESTCKKAEVRNGLISYMHGISEPLDHEVKYHTEKQVSFLFYFK